MTSQPNTVFASCPDGQGTGSFVSIESIRVETLDGSALAAGKTVRVTIVVRQSPPYHDSPLIPIVAP